MNFMCGGKKKEKIQGCLKNTLAKATGMMEFLLTEKGKTRDRRGSVREIETQLEIW